MSVQLPPRVEARIEQMISTGRYADAGEVIEQALRLLEARERDLAWLRAELAIGEAQEARGELVELTPDRFEEIKRQALDDARRGTPIRDAVKP
jgi:antitoxin ParD1/3/4